MTIFVLSRIWRHGKLHSSWPVCSLRSWGCIALSANVAAAAGMAAAAPTRVAKGLGEALMEGVVVLPIEAALEAILGTVACRMGMMTRLIF